jgi:hypothetical protein
MGAFLAIVTLAGQAAAQPMPMPAPTNMMPTNTAPTNTAPTNAAPELPVFPGAATPPAIATPPAAAITLPQPTPAMPPPVTPMPPVAAPGATAPAFVPPVATPPGAPVTSVASTSKTADILQKNPDTLFAAVALGKKSLMFSKSDINAINQLLTIYDTYTAEKKADVPSGDNDINKLLKELTSKHSTVSAEPPAPVVLPNVYLGSIVYYSPSNWSVWLNDKKLVNIQNVPTNEFYITRLSRTQMELVWKPKSIADTLQKWKDMTNGGKNPLPNITLDETKGTITLLMRPNQTFISRILAIREGLYKSSPNAGVTYEEHYEQGQWKEY